jgi:chromosome segregation ATPase
MSTRADRKETLAKAEANWRRANDNVAKTQEERAKASAAWDKVVVDWRKAGTSRRKADTAWDRMVPDRRKTESDRRTAEADFIAFSKRVADQHGAYLAWSKAETEGAAAQARLKSAAAERDEAIAALDGLNCADRKTQSVRPARLGQALVSKLRKTLLG